MIVYRVENADLIGPITQRWTVPSELATRMQIVCQRHPGPVQWATWPEITPKSKFAFSRMDTLKYVFEGVLEDLQKLGFNVVTLDVEPTAIGMQDQVIFTEFRNKGEEIMSFPGIGESIYTKE